MRVLASYHYHRDTDLAALVHDLGGNVDLFADSGAFSAATTGVTIKLGDYAAWLRHWQPLITVAATLDVIGDHRATAANLDRLTEAGCSVLPVFHTGEPWDVLEGLCAQHRYIALGGLALHAAGAAKQKALMAWLIRAFKVARPYGTALHGFGLTSANLVRHLPFYSIDSSSYTMGQRFGLVYLWDARTLRMRSLFFRNPADVLPNAALVRAHGLPPHRLLDRNFMRPAAGSTGADRDLLTAGCARAYQFMEGSLTTRHRVPAPPLPRAADQGTKVYLALSGARDQDIAPLRMLLEEGVR
nr:hypothetical protein [Streptomyces sp. SID5468]